MRKLTATTLFIVLAGFSLHINAQSNDQGNTNRQQESGQQQAEIRKNQQDQLRQNETRGIQANRMDALRRVSENPDIILTPRTEVRDVQPADKPTKEQKQLLKPDNQDFIAYEEFLKQPKTGLIKIFPDAGCQDNSRIVRVDDDCLKYIPNSGFYSFRRKKYSSEFFADIRLKNGFLISDGLLTQGIMTAVGDIPLEKVSLADDQLRFITQYKPEAQNKAADAQSKKITKGVKSGDYVYRSSWQAFENNTYVLRSIAYEGKYLISYPRGAFNLLDQDVRKDVTIAFRVIRKNPDGSVTILWKELDHKDSPKLIYPERRKDDKPKA